MTSCRFLPLSLCATAFLLTARAPAAHGQANATAEASLGSVPTGYEVVGDTTYTDLQDESDPSTATTWDGSPRIDLHVLRSDGFMHNDKSGAYLAIQYYQCTGSGSSPGASISGPLEVFGNCADNSEQAGSDNSSAVGACGSSGTAAGAVPDGDYDTFAFDDPVTWTDTWASGSSSVGVYALLSVEANSDPF